MSTIDDTAFLRGSDLVQVVVQLDLAGTLLVEQYKNLGRWTSNRYPFFPSWKKPVSNVVFSVSSPLLY